jgi:ADP-ribose pyrophosphatase YjhB (NUDIX family)
MTSMREYPTGPVVGVGVVVERSDGAMLLVERGAPPLEGYWSVPGGKVELGETTAAAAVREVREETGVEVAVERLLTVVDRIVPAADGRVQYHYVLIEYLARPTDPAAVARAASDARQARWMARGEVGQLRLVPGLEAVLGLVSPVL